MHRLYTELVDIIVTQVDDESLPALALTCNRLLAAVTRIHSFPLTTINNIILEYGYSYYLSLGLPSCDLTLHYARLSDPNRVATSFYAGVVNHEAEAIVATEGRADPRVRFRPYWSYSAGIAYVWAWIRRGIRTIPELEVYCVRAGIGSHLLYSCWLDFCVESRAWRDGVTLGDVAPRMPRGLKKDTIRKIYLVERGQKDMDQAIAAYYDAFSTQLVRTPDTAAVYAGYLMVLAARANDGRSFIIAMLFAESRGASAPDIAKHYFQWYYLFPAGGLHLDVPKSASLVIYHSDNHVRDPLGCYSLVCAAYGLGGPEAADIAYAIYNLEVVCPSGIRSAVEACGELKPTGMIAREDLAAGVVYLLQEQLPGVDFGDFILRYIRKFGRYRLRKLLARDCPMHRN